MSASTRGQKRRAVETISLVDDNEPETTTSRGEEEEDGLPREQLRKDQTQLMMPPQLVRGCVCAGGNTILEAEEREYGKVVSGLILGMRRCSISEYESGADSTLDQES